VKNVHLLQEVKELVQDGTFTSGDVACLRQYALNEYNNPNFEPEEEAPMWMSIGTFVLWLGWYFFNGGSTYTLYNSSMLSSKIITNTILGGSVAGGTVYFLRKPIAHFVCECF
jgi:ammonia channel protein AmtB